jgi:hypothetical protein
MFWFWVAVTTTCRVRETHQYTVDELRSVGLSPQKASYVADLVCKVPGGIAARNPRLIVRTSPGSPFIIHHPGEMTAIRPLPINRVGFPIHSPLAGQVPAEPLLRKTPTLQSGGLLPANASPPWARLRAVWPDRPTPGQQRLPTCQGAAPGVAWRIAWTIPHRVAHFPGQSAASRTIRSEAVSAAFLANLRQQW